MPAYDPDALVPTRFGNRNRARHGKVDPATGQSSLKHRDLHNKYSHLTTHDGADMSAGATANRQQRRNDAHKLLHSQLENDIGREDFGSLAASLISKGKKGVYTCFSEEAGLKGSYVLTLPNGGKKFKGASAMTKENVGYEIFDLWLDERAFTKITLKPRGEKEWAKKMVAAATARGFEVDLKGMKFNAADMADIAILHDYYKNGLFPALELARKAQATQTQTQQPAQAQNVRFGGPPGNGHWPHNHHNNNPQNIRHGQPGTRANGHGLGQTNSGPASSPTTPAGRAKLQGITYGNGST